MQTFKADGFQGKRLRLTGYVKSKDVADWAGLWVGVDGSEKTGVAFDNMGDRKIEGTADWTKYTIVLDVPKDAAAIAFGLLMSGKGRTFGSMTWRSTWSAPTSRPPGRGSIPRNCPRTPGSGSRQT